MWRRSPSARWCNEDTSCGLSGEVCRYQTDSLFLSLGGMNTLPCSTCSPPMAFSPGLGVLTLLLLQALTHPQPEFMSFSHSSMMFNVFLSPVSFLPEGTLAHLDPASRSLAPHPITTSQLDALTHLALLWPQKGPVIHESCCFWRISQSLASPVDTGLGRRRPPRVHNRPECMDSLLPHNCGWGPRCGSPQCCSISETA